MRTDEQIMVKFVCSCEEGFAAGAEAMSCRIKPWWDKIKKRGEEVAGITPHFEDIQVIQISGG